MNLLNEISRFVSSKIPRNNTLYNFFKFYIENFDGENNSNMVNNGELRLLKRILPKLKVIFDIGANIGDWTKIALTIKKDLNIYCFEPSKATFNSLIKNNFPVNVKCHNFGFSSRKSEEDLYIFEECSGLNSLYIRYGLEDVWGLKPQVKKEKIMVDTLDNYCENFDIKEIDFLKIDVEGHELEVLKGGRKIIEESRVKFIQFEYGGTFIDVRIFLKDIFDLFKNKNYSFFKIHPKFVEPINKYSQKLENFNYQNWLIMRNRLK
ncbi:MAG: FkbM family methyltransferase [Candidatus Lokiarchaeota archaeon]|nr:FkbM family methyltransferase [Candidatus Lokiarchaeota archaeon]